MDRQSPQPDQRWAVFGLIIITVGVIFLLGELFNFSVGRYVWPFFVLVPGAVFLALAFGRSPANAGPAVPGAVLTTLGLIFLFQVATGHWETWAYVWALIPLSVGLVLMGVGTRNGDEGMVRSGAQTARIFGIVFVAGLVFFQLIVFDTIGFGAYFLPILLIVVGGGILWMHVNRGGQVPWGDRFGWDNGPGETNAPPGPPPSAPPPSGSAPSGPAPTSASTPPPPPTPPPAALAETAVAQPPPAAPASAESGPNEHFPEDELPHEPAPDDAPFPVDEESPQPPAEPEKPAPKAPRRRSTSRKTTTRRQTKASDSGSDGSPAT